jgi:sulfate adenylyltransferase
MHNLAPIPELYVSADSAVKLKHEAGSLPSWDLSPRQTCDIELLMNGGFHPLKGFLGREDYDSVVDTMRLASGALWPIPVTLDVSEAFAAKVEPGQDIALRDAEGVILATMTVTDKWTPDKAREAVQVFGADDLAHPGVAYLRHRAGPVHLGGPITGLQPPVHYDFKARRDTPNELRAFFRKLGWRRIVAFQTRNPLHRAHQELTFRAAREAQANLLIPPRGGHDQARRRGPLHPRALLRGGAGPVPVLDHAPVAPQPRDAHGRPARGALARPHPQEPRAHPLHRGPRPCGAGQEQPGPRLLRALRRAGPRAGAPGRGRHRDGRLQADGLRPGEGQLLPRGRGARGLHGARHLGHRAPAPPAGGLEIPDWFSFPEVVRQLRRTSPERSKQGFTVFFTGFSGSGKSTIANALMVKLMEMGGRPVTLLDGDVVRKHLSSELGFSKEHRDINIKRIGYVASEITKNGGIAICAPIAPYAATRAEVREMIESYGAFVEVHVATSLEECERRDRKGLYKLAREGVIKEFTGISDPYDVPEAPELRLGTEGLDVDTCAHQVVLKLEGLGLIAA